MEVVHYRGDQRNFDPDRMLGPDVAGRRLVITAVDYDPGSNVSTATVRPVMAAEFRERIEPIVTNAQEWQRIRRLFGG